MSRVKLALAAGLGAIAVAICLVLAEHPTTVIATNATSSAETLAVASHKSARACQQGERVPRGTVAIRLSIGAYSGPKVTVSALSGKRVLASGERGPGWDGQNVTIPVGHVSRTIAPATICFATTLIDEEVKIFGSKSAKSVAARSGRGEPLSGRVSIEYMGVGHPSWLALVSSVAKQMGLGRAWSGTWISFFVLILMLTVTVVASRLIVREIDG